VISETPTVSQLSQVNLASGRACLYSGCAGGIHIGIGLAIESCRRSIAALNAIGGDDPARVHLKSDLPRMKRRALL